MSNTTKHYKCDATTDITKTLKLLRPGDTLYVAHKFSLPDQVRKRVSLLHRKGYHFAATTIGYPDGILVTCLKKVSTNN